MSRPKQILILTIIFALTFWLTLLAMNTGPSDEVHAEELDKYADAYGIIGINQVTFDATTPIANSGSIIVNNGVAVFKKGFNTGGHKPEVVSVQYSKDRTKGRVYFADNISGDKQTMALTAWEIKLHVNKNITTFDYLWAEPENGKDKD